jgi:hypothetical protein
LCVRHINLTLTSQEAGAAVIKQNLRAAVSDEMASDNDVEVGRQAGICGMQIHEACGIEANDVCAAGAAIIKQNLRTAISDEIAGLITATTTSSLKRLRKTAFTNAFNNL